MRKGWCWLGPSAGRHAFSASETTHFPACRTPSSSLDMSHEGDRPYDLPAAASVVTGDQGGCKRLYCCHNNQVQALLVTVCRRHHSWLQRQEPSQTRVAQWIGCGVSTRAYQ